MKRVFEGTVSEGDHYNTQLVTVSELGSGRFVTEYTKDQIWLEGLDGKRVRITVEVLDEHGKAGA